MSIEEYLAFKLTSDVRHEYIDGDVVERSGVSLDHVRIARNVLVGLESQLRREGRCEAFGSEMRVRAPDGSLFTYPDVVVACEGGRYEKGSVGTLLDPTVIADVLSPTTEAYDRGRSASAIRRSPRCRNTC